MVYYNDVDPFAVGWLESLIAEGLLPEGDIDGRSIDDIRPEDLLGRDGRMGYDQCHFFAGIAGWPLALQFAGWPSTRPVWTGSCPCQPYSQAGLRKGEDDARNLWPVWFELIKACRPPVVFGEQVASSKVIGYANEDLYRVRGGQTARSVQEIYRQRSLWEKAVVQGMPAGIRKGLEVNVERVSPSCQEEEVSKDCGIQSGVPNKERGEVSCVTVSPKMPKERPPLRSGQSCGRSSGNDRRGSMRTYGDSVQYGADEGEAVQLSLFGPDQSERRLSVQEYPCGVGGGEHDVGELGTGNDSRNSQGVTGGTGGIGDKRGITEGSDVESDGSVESVWLDRVFTDLEGAGYACAAADIPAASLGAPHIRQRLWWVGGLDDSNGLRRGECGIEEHGDEQGTYGLQPGRSGEGGYGPWENYVLIPCGDGKARRIEPGVMPLVDGFPGRVDQVRAYGNAIVPQVAAEFVRAYMEGVGDEASLG